MKPITVSWSEIDTFRQCPFKHQWAYKDRWTPPLLSAALSRGSLWHAVLEQHYNLIKQSQPPQRKDTPPVPIDLTAERAFRELAPLLYERGGEQTEDQELIEWMYEGYLKHYGLDSEWKIVAVEHAAEFWLPTPRFTRSMFKIKMKLDLIVKDENNRLWIVDHKSGRDLPNDKMLEFDDQFGLYTWGLRQMGRKVMGSIHNAARTLRYKDTSKPQLLEERFRRTLMNRSDQELNVIAVEAYKTARRAWSTPHGEAERCTNVDTCRWKCNFTEPCLAARKGVDAVSYLKDAGFVQNFERH